MKRSPLIILFVTVVIDLLGYGIILPLLPLYVTKYGGTPVIMGWLSTSFSVTQFLFAPLWGRASDLWGRRPLILLSLLGSALMFLLFGVAHSLWMLFVARAGAGILTAASLPVAQAYIADVTPPEKRARGMALIGVAFGIGFAFGPWLGAVLGRYGLAVPALCVAGLSFLNFLWSYFSLPETHVTDRDSAHARKVVFLDMSRFAAAFRLPALSELLTVFSVSTLAFAMMETTFTWLVLLRFMGLPFQAHHLSPQLEKLAAPTVSPIFGIVGVTVFLVQGAMMSGLAQRIGERTLVWVGSLLLTAALFGIGSAGSMGLIKVLAACLAAGSGILNPALSSLISQVSDPRDRGGVMGVQHGLSSFARMIAPLLGTWLLGVHFGVPFGAPYYLAGALMGLAFLLSLGLKSVPLRESAPSAPLGH